MREHAALRGVAGWVASSSGAVLDGASVVLTDLTANVTVRGVTVAGRGYWLPAPHGGTYVLMASHPGHDPVVDVVTVDGTVVHRHPFLTAQASCRTERQENCGATSFANSSMPAGS